MRNVSGKSCRENQNAHCVFNNPPPPKKIVPFMRLCGKMWKSQTGHTAWDNLTLYSRSADRFI